MKEGAGAVAEAPVRNFRGTRAELSPLSNSVFFFLSLKDYGGAYPPSWR
jgi:hypothetical protein